MTISFQTISVIHSVQSATKQKMFCIIAFKWPPGTASCTTSTAPQASSDTRKSHSPEKWLGSHVYNCIVKGFIGGFRSISKPKHGALVATDDKAPAVQGMFYNSMWGLQ